MNVKVLKLGDPIGRFSMIAEGQARVYYNTQRWSEAPEWLSREGYYLTYFDSLYSALKSAGLFFWHGEVWLVKVRKIHTDLPEGLDTVDLGRGHMKFLPVHFTWPQGARMAERIILVKKLGTVYGSDYTPVNGGE